MNIVKSIEEVDFEKQEHLHQLFYHTQHQLNKKINLIRNSNDEALKLCVTTKGDVFSQPVNKQRKRWVNQGKKIRSKTNEEKITSVSASTNFLLFVTENGQLWQQGLNTWMKTDCKKKLSNTDAFWDEAPPKVLKTWQVSYEDNCVAYVQCLQPDGLHKLYSIGVSKLGFLGQSDSTESKTFLPLAYDATDENQFEEIFLIGTMVMARSTLGELWCLGGADSRPVQGQ